MKMDKIIQRELGLGNHLIKNGFVRRKFICDEQLNKAVRLHDGRTNVYVSVNPYRDVYDYSTIKLINLPLDIDGNRETAHVIDDYLTHHDIERRTVFSGSRDSYHFYVKLEENGKLLNPSQSLRSTHHSLIDRIFGFQKILKHAKKRMAESEDKTIRLFDHIRNESGIDLQVSDIARLFRAINTVNMKSGKYCHSIDDINRNNFDEAIEPTIIHPFVGGKQFPLSVSDPFPYTDFLDADLAVLDEDLGGTIHIKDLKPCVQMIISKPNPSHIERYIACYDVIDYLSEGSSKRTKKLEREVLRFFSKLGWSDYNRSVTEYHIRWCLNSKRTSYTCKQIEEMGLCVGCEEKDFLD